MTAELSRHQEGADVARAALLMLVCLVGGE